MSTQNLKVRSGNRIVVQLDGKQIGMIQTVNANDDMAPDVASGIGDIHAQEYVPTMARHTLSVSAMVLRKGNLREAGVLVENGDDALQGRVMDFIVYDKDDGSVLRKYIGCSYASGSINIQKHAIIVTDAQFMALDVVGTGV